MNKTFKFYALPDQTEFDLNKIPSIYLSFKNYSTNDLKKGIKIIFCDQNYRVALPAGY